MRLHVSKPVFRGTILFLGEIPRKTSFETCRRNSFYEENGTTLVDIVQDDTSLVMNLKGKGLVILSGCAHSGIINTVTHARRVTGIEKVHVIMGGFHLTGPDFEPIIGDTLDSLREN